MTHSCALLAGIRSKGAYKVLIGKIDLFNKIYCIGMHIASAFLYLAVLPYSLLRYYVFNLGADSFYLFVPSYVTKWPDELKTIKIQQIFFCIELRFPFDWRTPSGYLMAWFAQCAGALTGGSIYTQFPNLVFGTCWLFIFIAEDITMEVDAFNVDVKRSLGRNRAKLTKRFCDMVQLYWDAKHRNSEFKKNLLSHLW